MAGTVHDATQKTERPDYPALGVPSAVLGVTSAPDQRPTLDGVDRREFLEGATGLAVTALLPRTVATPGRIEAADVTQCWTALRRLYELDDRHGGIGTVRQLTEGMARRLQDALRQGSYLPAVGRELQKVTAATMEHAGWLAYDAGWQDRARRWWLETGHFTDVAEVPGVRVTVLVSMALQAGDAGNGREAVDLVQGARKTATHTQENLPLLSLLAAREAIGHAQADDRGAAVSALGQARQWLDRGRRGNEPFRLSMPLTWTGSWPSVANSMRPSVSRLRPSRECTRGAVPAGASPACTALLTCSDSRSISRRQPSRLPPAACFPRSNKGRSDRVGVDQLTVTSYGTDTSLAQGGTVRDLYAEIYAEPPYHEGPAEVRDFASGWHRTIDQRNFRLVIARRAGEPMGFAFGVQLRTRTKWWAGAPTIRWRASLPCDDQEALISGDTAAPEMNQSVRAHSFQMAIIDGFPSLRDADRRC